MRSVIGTIIMFIALYIVLANDMLGFFAQESFFIFALGSVILMLVVAIAVLGLPFKKKRGEKDDENKNLS